MENLRPELWNEALAEKLLELLNDEAVRLVALSALENLPPELWNEALAEKLLELLNDKAVSSDALGALKNLPGEMWSEALAAKLLELLNDKAVSLDALTRLKNLPLKIWSEALAAKQLKIQYGDPKEFYAWATLKYLPNDLWHEECTKQVFRLNKETNRIDSGLIGRALKNSPHFTGHYISRFNTKDDSAPGEFYTMLLNPASKEVTASIEAHLADRMIKDSRDPHFFRVVLYCFSKRSEDAKWLARWAGRDISTSEKPEVLSRLERCKRYLATPECKECNYFSRDLAEKIVKLVESGVHNGMWNLSEHSKLLYGVRDVLNQAKFSAQTALVDNVITDLERQDIWLAYLKNGSWVAGSHLVFWILLIFFYPRSPWVQGFFFWNKWVRRILGVGYVGLLLMWVPFLRRRLFKPFEAGFLVDAGLQENKEGQFYFDQAPVRNPKGTVIDARTVPGELQGLCVLIGASGLGKTLLLRQSIAYRQHAGRIPIFLAARDCQSSATGGTQGVLGAIQSRLQGHARDEAYLKQLIFAGALDIYIDGLNEVGPDTRAEVSSFLRDYSRGTIVLATQPLTDWNPPKSARVFELLPLTRNGINDFLNKNLQKNGLDEKNSELRSKEFLNEVLERDGISEEEKKQAAEVLSNPMDLTLVAEMLKEEQHPNIWDIMQQSYNLMAAEYSKRHAGQVFPLEHFCKRTYELRKAGQQTRAPGEAEFSNALFVMEDRKLLHRRSIKLISGEEEQEWFFRHDKIMDFFITHHFVKNQKLIEVHLSEAPFRGAYFLLALNLEESAAHQLRETILEDAVKRDDFIVLKGFENAFKRRKRKSA